MSLSGTFKGFVHTTSFRNGNKYHSILRASPNSMACLRVLPEAKSTATISLFPLCRKTITSFSASSRINAHYHIHKQFFRIRAIMRRRGVFAAMKTLTIPPNPPHSPPARRLRYTEGQLTAIAPLPPPSLSLPPRPPPPLPAGSPIPPCLIP